MKLLKNYKLFVDLDGVLADFDSKVEEITGTRPDRSQPQAEPGMWKAIEKYGTFYRDLKPMPDAVELWYFLHDKNPTVLTGISRQPDCAAQKRAWCTHYLGVKVPVITCASKDKSQEAWKITSASYTPLLIDDWVKYRLVWEENGGTFILHTSAQDTIIQLQALGVGP
jgi:hypothetical protein